MKLVEIKDINKVVNQIKTDIEQLSKIEIPDNKQIKELKKRLTELKTAKRVMEELGQKTDIIDKQIAELEKQIKKSDIQLTEKEKLLLRLLELYGVKINRKKSGGKSVKKVIYITEKSIKEFNSFGELQKALNIEGRDNNPKRVVLRWIQKTAPKAVIIADSEIVYAHPEINPELYQKFLE